MVLIDVDYYVCFVGVFVGKEFGFYNDIVDFDIDCFDLVISLCGLISC